MPSNDSPSDANDRRGATNDAGSLADIGQRLRHARLAAGLSLREMARRVGVSSSMVSQVELGRTKPSVGTLYSMASELSVALDDLMPLVQQIGLGVDAQGGTRIRVAKPGRPPVDSVNSPVQRGAERHELRMEGAVWGRLTSDHDAQNDFLHVVYAPGGESCPEDNLIHHRGHEYGFVVSGTLRVQVGFTQYDLHENDSISFDSVSPHRLFNPFEEPTTSIWMVVGRGGTPVL